MEYRDFKFEVKTVTEDGTFTALAAVYDELDLNGDIIDRGFFTKTLKENPTRIMLWQHKLDEPIGKATAKDSDDGLIIDGEFNLEVQRAREAHALMKKKHLTGISFGYDTIKDAWAKGIRHLKEGRVWEFSPVSIPAQPKAQVLSVKSAVPFQDLPIDEEMAWDSRGATNRVAEYAGGPDKEKMDWQKYRQAFLWFDPEISDSFGAYKLPIADVKDGRLVAVWKGIVAAAAGVQGARGGVAIPDTELAAVKVHLARYYGKLDKEPPWSGKGIDFEYAVEVMAAKISELKVGKILSASNRSLIARVMTDLQALLDLADGKDKEPAPGDSEESKTSIKGDKPEGAGEPEEYHSLMEKVNELRKEVRQYGHKGT